MIDEKTNYVEGDSLGDVWREAMWLCVKNGYDFVVKGGSYMGQIRRQLPFVTIVAKTPWSRPLAPQVPPGCPPPTDENYICQDYFPNYLMSTRVKRNEEYTYGTFIVPQLPRAIEIFRAANGNTNQACITVGDVRSIKLKDPPCLKLVDFKGVNGKVNMTVYFRSWDLFSGLPENLGGLQLVKEYFVSEVEDLAFQDGSLIAHSSGLHIYEQYFSLANTLNVDKVKVADIVLKDKKEFAKTLDE